MRRAMVLVPLFLICYSAPSTAEISRGKAFSLSDPQSILSLSTGKRISVVNGVEPPDQAHTYQAVFDYEKGNSIGVLFFDKKGAVIPSGYILSRIPIPSNARYGVEMVDKKSGKVVGVALSDEKGKMIGGVIYFESYKTVVKEEEVKKKVAEDESYRAPKMKDSPPVPMPKPK